MRSRPYLGRNGSQVNGRRAESKSRTKKLIAAKSFGLAKRIQVECSKATGIKVCDFKFAKKMPIWRILGEMRPRNRHGGRAIGKRWHWESATQSFVYCAMLRRLALPIRSLRKKPPDRRAAQVCLDHRTGLQHRESGPHV